MARRRLTAGLTLAAALGLGVAAPAQAAAPFVQVTDVDLQRGAQQATVTAKVAWNADGAREQQMTAGDLRLVAVSEDAHLPTVLATRSGDVGDDRLRDVTLVVRDDDARAAMAPGNRIVLTASQHRPVSQASFTPTTYVTVAQVQRFGSPQPHIGSDDCSDVAIRPGANLNQCDLVGADLDGAFVSEHDPKAYSCKFPSRSSCLVRADLTGATMVRSQFSGATVAGGRLNGTDLSRAQLDNLSLAGAEAIELVARQATSDKQSRDSGANFFATRLDRADLRGTVFNGVSFARATLDGVQAQNAAWTAVFADQASFRGADLSTAALGPTASVVWADFRRADLSGTGLTDLQLAWPLLCATTLPDGSKLDAGRDCRTGAETPTTPAPNPDRAQPYVTVSAAKLDRARDGSVAVTADVAWDADSRPLSGYGMYVGDLRLVAIDAGTGRARVLDTKQVSPIPAAAQTSYAATLDRPADVAAMAKGNRVVLTATQHPPFQRGARTTGRSYVTVATLQRGPARGRVGMYDCSRIAIVTEPVRPDDLQFCDLAGATLDTAGLGGTRFMQDADLSGASWERGQLTAVTLDGAALAGLDADGSAWSGVDLRAASAPGLSLADGAITGGRWQADELADVRLTGSRLYQDVQFAGSPMRRAQLAKTELDHTDLAYADLRGAVFDDAVAERQASLFLADLTDASLAGSEWTLDEEQDWPWRWATLCRTTMPPRDGGFDGDRDCPR